ncbi:hypothetical protein FOL47_008991 [Perkinsus chesapeaki]|uniref:Intraflagellar transport protein 56 n=1 Tax=Perkinsus chesapeaki TaxID=330153 RepID=A0A7J6MTP8_PERCH|nr:hypothetical protein FOL47_008991 [Perkinsus chesapeaki]
MAWNNNEVLPSTTSAWKKSDDPTVVLDLPFDTPPSGTSLQPQQLLPTTPGQGGQPQQMPASPSGTMSTCSSSDVACACGMSSPPYGALQPLTSLESPTTDLFAATTPTQSQNFLTTALNGPTGLSTAFADSSTDVLAQEPGLDALSRIIAARCVDPLTLPQAAVQDNGYGCQCQPTTDEPALKRAKVLQEQQPLQEIPVPRWGGDPMPTADYTTRCGGGGGQRGVAPYMMLNSLRKKEYAAPPGVWKNSGGYISTVYVNKRRIYGPLRKTLEESVRDREEMLIAKENHASEEEIRELVAALKEINGGGSRGSKGGRRHRKSRKSTKSTTSSNSSSATSSTTSGSSDAGGGCCLPTIPGLDQGGSEQLPSLAARFQNENYFGGFSPESFGFAQY